MSPQSHEGQQKRHRRLCIQVLRRLEAFFFSIERLSHVLAGGIQKETKVQYFTMPLSSSFLGASCGSSECAALEVANGSEIRFDL